MTGVELHGGGPSISVRFDELTGLADRLGRAATELARAVLPVLARLGSDPTVLATAALDPAGAAACAELLVACLGLLTATALECESLAGLLRSAARCYRAADELDRRGRPAIRAGRRLPAALAAATSRPGTIDLQAGLTADPELADLPVQLLCAWVAGPAGALLPGAGSRVAGLLSLPYRDGRPVLTSRPDLLRSAADDRAGPPRSTSDLMRGLQVRVEADDGGGLVDVRTVDGPGGRRVIVNIAGTTRWNLDPRRRTPQASDLSTNLRSLAGRSSVLQRGVVLALRRAGVGPTEPIMLVGHSQGGLVAAQLAAELTASRQFRVTHLVTAGAPIGLARLPSSVSVLALENTGDLVPQLDGADNPDRPNWLTAELPSSAPTVGGQHAVASYRAGASQLDRCQDRTLRSWRTGAAGFLSGHTIRTQVFQIRRAP